VTPVAGVVASQVLASLVIRHMKRQDGAAAFGGPAGGLMSSLTQDVIRQSGPARLPVTAEVPRREAVCKDARHVLPLGAVMPNAVRHDLSISGLRGLTSDLVCRPGLVFARRGTRSQTVFTCRRARWGHVVGATAAPKPARFTIADLCRQQSYIRFVTLADVTREGVVAAIGEFERVGRRQFLRSTGFRGSREYYLAHGGKLYDSKPIVGYAHGVSVGTPLGPADFSGGDRTVARRLESLGFEVQRLPYVDWTRDELVLACELVRSNRWRQLPADDAGVVALSQLLQSR
jgi:hypothetical protein